ncbi:hypothetical protein A4X13_0g9468, partial [Tilletia indica]
MPRSRSGKDAVLVIEDLFSRMILLHPCSSSIDAAGIAAIISDRVLRNGWRPRRLISDSEAKMTGTVMQSLAKSLGARLTPSPPHHQQANAVERSIQTVKHVLQALCTDGHAHWDTRAVPAAELALNSTPSITTGYRPFDLVFVAHPDIVHAVFDVADPEGVGSFGEHLAMAAARLEDARRATASARALQKARYDSRRAPLPALVEGDSVFVRLPDRPVAGTSTHKLTPRKLGPFPVRQVLSDHRVELELPPDVGIGPEFSVEQLDVVPRSPDPFLAHRPRSADVADDPPASGSSTPVSPPPLPVRSRSAPSHLRDFQVGLLEGELQVPYEVLRGPYFRPKEIDVDGCSVTLVERPVAFLSRLTTVSEKRLVAPELELSCLAWAFATWSHLLEGAEVTIITDHAPMSAMLT